MGASQSTSAEKVFHNETPIQFSQDVVDQLSDRLASPETTPERQSTLDAHIRERIQSGIELLRQEEERVREEIQQTLEKENLDRERSMAGEASEAGDTASGTVKSSAALLGDLEEIQTKIDRFKSRSLLTDHPAVKAYQEAVVSCYKNNPTTSLECWREVNQFKASVAQVEQEYFKSLQ